DFDYTTEEGEERWAVGGLISASGPKGEGVIRFQFGVDVAPILAEPAVFARLKLAVIGQFVSKYAGMMYELLELRANMNNPTWEIGVDDLRALLGVTGKMTNFAHFRNYALTSAISEINEKSDIAVTMTETKKGRKVESLTFTIEKKDFRQAMESELQHKSVRKSGAAARVKRDGGGSKRDPDTVDMLDRRTGRERGGWPPLLKSETLEQVREIAAGWDVGFLEREWYGWQQGKEAPRDPDKAFLGWVKGYVKNHRLT
ncbi:MAG: replication initiation protein, partial [Alphaproteobacteria bacterium]|nr:replication initiation protein [Alphaproteobacteria bacterium]